MKLFRFIRNTWNTFWDHIFDGEDLKNLTKHFSMWGLILVSMGGVMYALGLIGTLFGWQKYIKDESVMSLGIVISVLLFFLLIVGLIVWQTILNLKEIWNRS